MKYKIGDKVFCDMNIWVEGDYIPKSQQYTISKLFNYNMYELKGVDQSNKEVTVPVSVSERDIRYDIRWLRKQKINRINERDK